MTARRASPQLGVVAVRQAMLELPGWHRARGAAQVCWHGRLDSERAAAELAVRVLRLGLTVGLVPELHVMGRGLSIYLREPGSSQLTQRVMRLAGRIHALIAWQAADANVGGKTAGGESRSRVHRGEPVGPANAPPASPGLFSDEEP